MSRVMQFMSVGGASFTLRIQDGSQTETTLTAGPQPFVVQMDDSDDPFTPVRTSTGNIQIVGGVSDINTLVSAAPEDRYVELRCTNSQGAPVGVVWQGFLQTRAYSQSLDRSPITIDFPVMSVLNILKSTYPPSGQSDMGYISFAQFLDDMNKCISVNSSPGFWIGFYFPAMSDPDTTLYYKFSMRAYSDWIDAENRWQTQSYYDILEDICKLFGWQCQEYGYNLIFCAFDANVAGYKYYSAANLASMAAGTTVTGTDVTVVTDQSKIIWGANHRVDYIDGKNKIVVTGDVQPVDTTIWKFNLDKYTPNNSESASYENGYYYTRNYLGNEEIDVITSYNFKFANFVNDDENIYGCCMTSDRFIVVISAVSNKVPESDTGWMNHFIFRTTSSMESTVIMSITTLDYVFYNKLLNNKRMVLNMHIQRCKNRDGQSYEDYTGFIRCRVKIGSTKLHNSDVLYLYATNGRLTFRWGWELTEQGYAFVFPPTVDGRVTFELLGFEALHDDGSYYYSISEISFSYAENWTIKQEWEKKDNNKESSTISGGFEDEYDVDFRLTTFRTGQFGWGIIQGKNHMTDKVPTVLYNNKTPEKALLDRLKTYYSVSRRQVVLELNMDGSPLIPINRYYISGAGTFACLSQELDWANDTVKARMCEI